MPVTIDTSNATAPSGYDHQQGLDRTSNGTLWTVHNNNTPAAEFWYSTDDGATFTEDTGAQIAGWGNGSMFIEHHSNGTNYVHVIWEQDGTGGSRTDGYLYYRRGTLNSTHTAITWGTVQIVNAGTTAIRPDIAAFARPDGTTFVVVACAFNTGDHTGGLGYKRLVLDQFGELSSSTVDQLNTLSDNMGVVHSAGGSAGSVSVDFYHVGDAKTPASNPHVWVAGDNGTNNDVFLRKANWGGASYSWGNVRTLSTTVAAGQSAMRCDGARVLVAVGTTSDTIEMYERDIPDSATTTRTATALSDGAITAVAVTYDNHNSASSRDAYVFAVGGTSRDPKYVQYDRSAGTWGSWTTVEAADVVNGAINAKRGGSHHAIECLYSTGAVTPHTIRYDQTVEINQAPNAPTWTTTNNQPHDVAATLPLDWDFTDPDTGDAQSAYALKRDIGGTVTYWNASTQVFGSSEVQNSSTTTGVTLPANWGNDGDATHTYYVRVWDDAATPAASSYSSGLSVVPDAKVNPTIDSPADGNTIVFAEIAVAWTVAEQSSYRLRLYTQGRAAQLWEENRTNSTLRSRTIGPNDYAISDNTTYVVGLATRTNEGLLSTEDTASVLINFVEPPAPQLTATADDTDEGAITVRVSNPAPSPDQPAVVQNHLYRRVVGDTDDGTRVAVGVAEGGTYVDWAVASGVAYEWRARAIAGNGTTQYGDWTS